MVPLEVKDLGRDPNAVLACLRAMGIEAPIGDGFDSVIPGHENHEALVEQAPSGAFVYRCDCDRDGAGDATLAEVYAASFYRDFKSLSPSARALWHRLLLAKAGRLKPRPVHLPVLPDEADRDAQLARRMFSFALGLREHDHPGQPMMFSRGFVAAICKIDERRAREAIETLVSNGVIRRLSQRWKGAYLYLPGAQSQGSARR